MGLREASSVADYRFAHLLDEGVEEHNPLVLEKPVRA